MPTRDFLRWWLPAFVAAALLFWAFPGLDIAVATRFWGGGGSEDWPLRWQPSLVMLRQAISHLVWLPVLVVGAGALARLVWTDLPPAFSLRAVVFLALTYALGPGLLVNFLLKGYWGRARPEGIAAFGGAEPFTPAWLPSAAGGASFVSGEVSIAAATCAVALLARGRARLWLFMLGFALASAIGAIRIAQGGHFPSDVVFAMLLTWLVAWLAHSLVFRWSPGAAVRAAPPRASAS